MNSYNNALSISLLALVVIIVIHLLFNGRKSYESEEAFNPIKQEDANLEKVIGIGSNYAQQRKVVKHRTNNCCPVDRSVRDNDVYLQKYLLGAPLGPQKCSTNCASCVQSSLDLNEGIEKKDPACECCTHSDPSRSCTNCTHQDVCNITQHAPKSAKEFSDDFFGFRDRSTFMNSSIRFDAVDKIQDLYLSGNLSHARGFPENTKIKDLFDCATSGPTIYKRSCVRLPTFDNMNPVDDHVSYGTPGLYATADQWQYPNEKIINGGEIDNGVYGTDAYASTNYPVVRNN